MKGHITEALMILLLVAIALMFGIIITARFTDVFTDEFEEGSCAASVRTHSTIVDITNEEATPKIDCPTVFIKEKVTNEEAQELIANEMARCWAVWGKGQLPLFGEQAGTYCHVCSMLTLEGIDQVTGLPEYLDTTEFGNDRTYAQYITGQKTGTVFTEADYADTASTILKTDKPVAIVFLYAKDRTFIQKAWLLAFKNPVLAGATVGVGLGAITVASGGSAGLAITTGTAGAAGGGVASILARPDASTMSTVYARPMTAEQIHALNCQFLEN